MIADRFSLDGQSAIINGLIKLDFLIKENWLTSLVLYKGVLLL